MLSFLQHVHDCQRSIDCKEGETKASYSGVSATGSLTQATSPQKTVGAKHRTRKEEPTDHRNRKPRVVIPREIRVYHDMEPISPLRNPRTQLSVEPQKREKLHRPTVSPIEIDDGKVEMSVDDNSTAVSELMGEAQEWHEERRNERRITQCSSVTSGTSTVLDDLEMRSKGTIRSRPCYSEIKGHVPQVTPQQSPARRFSVDNGQLVNGKLAEAMLCGVGATGSESVASSGTSEKARNNEEQQQITCSSPMPTKRAQSLLPNLHTPIRGPPLQVGKSPLSPTKRCSLAPENLLQTLKATYSPRTPTRKRVVSGAPADDTHYTERNHGLDCGDGTSHSDVVSPRKSPRRSESKGCLPALSPRLSSPTKTKHHDDILLPFSACKAGKSLDITENRDAGTRRRPVAEMKSMESLDRGASVVQAEQDGARCRSETPSRSQQIPSSSGEATGQLENRRSRRSSMGQVTDKQHRASKHRSSSRRSSMGNVKEPRRSSMGNVKEPRRSSMNRSRQSLDTQRDQGTGTKGRPTRGRRRNSISEKDHRQRRRGSAIQSKERSKTGDVRPRRSSMSNRNGTRRSSMSQVSESYGYRNGDKHGSNRRQTMSHLPPETGNVVPSEKEQVQRYIAGELGKMQRNLSDSSGSRHRDQRRRTLTHVETLEDGKAGLQAYIARQLEDSEWKGVVRSLSKQSSIASRSQDCQSTASQEPSPKCKHSKAA